VIPGQNLPPNWCWTTLGEIASIQGGIQKQPKRAPKDNAFPFLRVANVMRGKLDLSEVHRIELFGDELNRLRLQPGDLLIVEGNGSPSEIGRLGIWDGSIQDCVHQNHIIRARLRADILPAYVAAYWNSAEGARGLLDLASSTSGLYTLSVSKVSGFAIPLAPPEEQNRIVAEIEKHQSRVDAALSALQHARTLVTRFRKAALSITVTPPRSFAGAGHYPRVTLEDVLREPLRNGHSAKASPNGHGIRTLTLSAVTYRDFGEHNTKITAAQAEHVKGLWLEPGDILIERSNTPELVGSSALFEGEPAYAIFPDLLIRIRTNDKVAPTFLELVLRAESSRTYFRQRAQGSAGTMPKIDQGIIERFEFHLPPVSDQIEVSQRVRGMLGRADRLEAEVLRAGKRAARLRQSILKRAFEGRLVPQDPNDEPAETLLLRAVGERPTEPWKTRGG